MYVWDWTCNTFENAFPWLIVLVYLEFLELNCISGLAMAVRRVAFASPVACAARNALKIERVATDSAVISWATPSPPPTAAYIVKYATSRLATRQPRAALRNLTPGASYKLDVARADTGEPVASGTLQMTAAEPAEPAVELPLTELSRLEIRVGVIRTVERHPDADTLYVEQVDVGEGEERTIVSGLVKYCSAEELTGRRVLVLCNLKPRAMRGVESRGMLLCASNEEHTDVDPLLPPPDAPLGELVTFDGHRPAPIDPGNRATKAFDRVADKLSCGPDGVAKFEDVPFMTESGPCTSPKKLVGPVS